jgi:transposase
MDIHKNARLTPRSRAELVRRVLIERQTPKAAATAFGVCVKTVRKWVERFLAEGEAGLMDRSSRPHRLRQPTLQAVVEEIERLRRQRLTGKQIAAASAVSPATVSRVLRRLGLNKLSALEPAEPVRRYEREEAGELIRYQEARSDWLRRAPHHRTTSWRGQPSPRHRLGVRPRLHRRCFARRFRAGHGQPAQGECCRLPRSCRCLFRRAWHSHRTTARAIGQRLSEQPASASVFAKSSQGPTHPGPTVRLSASSKQRFVNGLTPVPIRARINDPPSCSTGSIATIGIVHMVA